MEPDASFHRARYATWQAVPGDPRSALGWFMADHAFERLPAPLALVLIGFLVFMAMNFGVGFLCLAPFVLLHVRRDAEAIDFSPLITEPSPGPAFAMRVEVWRDGAMLGEDEGIATFVEGWLHYGGRRTEFALRRGKGQDVESLPGTWWLIDGDLRLRFEAVPAARSQGLLPHETGGFARALRAWFHSTPAPRGEPVEPPNVAHPSGYARAWRGIVSTLVFPALGYGLLAVVAPRFGGGFLLLGVLAPGRLGSLRTLRRHARRAVEAR